MDERRGQLRERRGSLGDSLSLYLDREKKTAPTASAEIHNTPPPNRNVKHKRLACISRVHKEHVVAIVHVDKGDKMVRRPDRLTFGGQL